MNETLRRAIFRSGLDLDAVAARLGVDPKTVRRWLDGRMPYPRLRWQLAMLLGADETDLWPELLAVRDAGTRPAEVIAIYSHRWTVPRDVWHCLFSSANQEIAILAYSALFIAEDAGLVRILCAKATDGVRVRIALGDPDCAEVAQRGSQEGIDSAMAARIRNALVLYRPLAAEPNAEIRLHRTVLYNSIYQGDQVLLVNQHMYGIPAGSSPVLHLSGNDDGEMIRGYAVSFERLWSRASII